MKRIVQNIFIFAYVALLLMMLGAVLFETFINYPNWFYNIPASLETTSKFLQARNPGHFFQTIFLPLAVAAIGFIIFGWKIKAARNLILISLILLVGIEALTQSFAYPRLDILFQQGAAQHPIELLKQTAQEFLTVSYIRLASIIVVNVLAFTGLKKFIRYDADHAV